MSLREITKDLHHQAETTAAAKLLLSGKIAPEMYASWLYQLIMIYGPIEFGCRSQGFFDNLPGIDRLPSIYQDFIELAGTEHKHTWMKSTLEYHDYLITLLNNPETKHLIKAHSYVRHMGDLSGGQIVAKQTPGSGKMFQVANIDKIKPILRASLTDDLGEEAIVAFQWNIKVLREFGGE
jgi:heme oxygenase